MQKFFEKIGLIIKDPSLRNRIIFVAVMLVIFRALSAIPVPGVDINRLQAFFAGPTGDIFGLFNIFSGGGLSNISIVMLGVGPYITASIVMQLLTMIFPKLKEMYQQEGEAGKAKFTQYSRLLTVPLALVQGGGFLLLLKNQGVVTQLGSLEMIANVMVIIAGSMLLMWIGELMTEFGIGNGTSLIIFAGIVASVPTSLAQLSVTFSASQIPMYVAFLFIALLVVLSVVIITEAERPIPVTYAKRVRGSKVYGGVSTYLPLRVNQAGVIPIIFALSILLFPQMIFQYLLSAFPAGIMNSISTHILALLKNGWFYSIFYFLLVFLLFVLYLTLFLLLFLQ